MAKPQVKLGRGPPERGDYRAAALHTSTRAEEFGIIPPRSERAFRT